jgi:undecaprenyl-diphosphatase
MAKMMRFIERQHNRPFGGYAGSMLAWDARLLEWVVAHRIHALDGPMHLLTIVGRGGQIWLAIGVVLACARLIDLASLLRLALAILLATLVADHVLKPLVGRDRPFTTIAGLDVIGDKPTDRSFPSGHSANAFAGATTLARARPDLAVAWWILAASIAFSRVYLGVHYPLDVIGGAIVGAACGLLAGALVTRAGRRRRARAAGGESRYNTGGLK